MLLSVNVISTLIGTSALIVVKVPGDFLGRADRVHIAHRLCLVWWVFLYCSTRQHRHYTQHHLRSLQRGCPIFWKCRQTDISVWVNMAMYWRSSNKHDLRGFKRIFFIEFKLQRVAFADVYSTFGHRKADSPDWWDFTYHFQRKFLAILCVYVLRLLCKSNTTLHF
jgi:hypothetical protein